jgi:hypothetical protein
MPHITYRQSEFDTLNYNLKSDSFYNDTDLTRVRMKKIPIGKVSKISLGMSNDKKKVVKSSSKSLKKSKKSKK